MHDPEPLVHFDLVDGNEDKVSETELKNNDKPKHVLPLRLTMYFLALDINVMIVHKAVSVHTYWRLLMGFLFPVLPACTLV